MEQLRAVNALEPFVLLSKSATSPRAAADLIKQATSSPHTYVFAELLQTPNIQALQRSSEYSSHLKLLEIFAWGTWEDYRSSQGLPKLSPSQHQKLLLLSLLPLARDNKPLSYSKLQSALSLPNVEALESLITNALYTDLIDGALDPHNQVVHIDSVAPLRDLRPGSVPTLTQAFESWSAQCASTLAELQKEIDLVNDKAKAKAQRDKRIQQIFVAKMEMSEEGKGKRGPDPNDDNDSDENGDEMDIDAEAARGSRSKRSLLGSVGRRLVG